MSKKIVRPPKPDLLQKFLIRTSPPSVKTIQLSKQQSMMQDAYEMGQMTGEDISMNNIIEDFNEPVEIPVLSRQQGIFKKYKSTEYDIMRHPDLISWGINRDSNEYLKTKPSIKKTFDEIYKAKLNDPSFESIKQQNKSIVKEKDKDWIMYEERFQNYKVTNPVYKLVPKIPDPGPLMSPKLRRKINEQECLSNNAIRTMKRKLAQEEKLKFLLKNEYKFGALNTESLSEDSKIYSEKYQKAKELHERSLNKEKRRRECK